MASPKAPVLDGAGKQASELALEESVFGAEIKAQLVHETVRAEMNAARAGTRGGKSRGLVAGGRAKPWRQKGTGRARQGTTRAVQWTGGGLAFPPTMRSFEVKVNRKARKAALASALSDHAQSGTLAIVDGAAFEQPSTRQASTLLAAWERSLPLVVVAHEDEEALIKSFRNIQKVLVTVPSDLEVGAVVWARSLLVTQAALPLVQQRAEQKRTEQKRTEQKRAEQ